MAAVGTKGVWGGCASSKPEKNVTLEVNLHHLVFFFLRSPHKVRHPISAKKYRGCAPHAPPSKSVLGTIDIVELSLAPHSSSRKNDWETSRKSWFTCDIHTNGNLQALQNRDKDLHKHELYVNMKINCHLKQWPLCMLYEPFSEFSSIYHALEACLWSLLNRVYPGGSLYI